MTLALSQAQQEVVLANQEGIYRVAKVFMDTTPSIKRRHSREDIRQAAMMAFMEGLIEFDLLAIPGDRFAHCERFINARLKAMSRQGVREDHGLVDGNILVEGDAKRVDDTDQLATILARLNPEQREIITMRYGIGWEKEMSQADVARLLGVERKKISRMEQRIEKCLRGE